MGAPLVDLHGCSCRGEAVSQGSTLERGEDLERRFEDDSMSHLDMCFGFRFEAYLLTCWF